MRPKILALAAALLATFAVDPSRAPAATTERIVSDPRSGIALHGFDPVAYFIDGQPRIGASQYEFRFGGLTWRFRSAANRAAFAQSPEVFVPVFGGYDPVAVSGSVPLPGHPALFTIEDGKLYLFSSEAHRARFHASPRELIEAARIVWPALRQSLVP